MKPKNGIYKSLGKFGYLYGVCPLVASNNWWAVDVFLFIYWIILYYNWIYLSIKIYKFLFANFNEYNNCDFKSQLRKKIRGLANKYLQGCGFLNYLAIIFLIVKVEFLRYIKNEQGVFSVFLYFFNHLIKCFLIFFNSFHNKIPFCL